MALPNPISVQLSRLPVLPIRWQCYYCGEWRLSPIAAEMFKNLLVIGVLLTFVVACSAWFWPFTTETPAVFQHENVLSLTKENFEELVSFLRYVCFPPKDYSKAEATLFWDEGNKPSALMTLSIRAGIRVYDSSMKGCTLKLMHLNGSAGAKGGRKILFRQILC